MIPCYHRSEIITFSIDLDEQMDFKAQPKERTKRNHTQDIREQDEQIEIVIVA